VPVLAPQNTQTDAIDMPYSMLGIGTE